MTAEVALATTPLADRLEYSKALSVADLLPPSFRNKPANVLLAMEAGISLGKSAMEIIQNAHVINGKLGFSAEFQRALVLQSGHKIRVFMDGETAVAQGIRADDPSFTYEVRWDADRARAAGLTSDNWRKHQAAMLKARATTELCRDAFADVIRGYRTTEELQDIAPAAVVTQIRPGDTLRAAAGLPVEPVEDDVQDAEIVNDVTEGVELITRKQMNRMQALFGEIGATDRDDRMAFVAEALGHENTQSATELTTTEASAVIDLLAARTGGQ